MLSILMALSPNTSQSGSRALFPPLAALFESPYEKGPNCYGQSINKDQGLLGYQGDRSLRLPHFFTTHLKFNIPIYKYDSKNCIES